ncbi:MAG: T9SS type A sorting domain-containing protein, partial [Flavobacteriales bacterium]
RVTSGGGNNFYVDDININNIVGLDELDALTGVSIFPNPMTNQATIELDLKKDAEVNVSVINAVGALVHQVASKQSVSQGNTQFKFSKNNLSSGVYFVNIEVNGTRQIKKLVIN